jgi:hypothetical protein
VQSRGCTLSVISPLQDPADENTIGLTWREGDAPDMTRCTARPSIRIQDFLDSLEQDRKWPGV